MRGAFHGGVVLLYYAFWKDRCFSQRGGAFILRIFERGMHGGFRKRGFLTEGHLEAGVLS